MPDYEGIDVSELCLFCSRPATHYCDQVIAMVDGGWHKPAKGPPHKVTSMDAMLSCSYTCDAPICSEHGRMVGHICGKDHDTIDHCVGCFGKPDGRSTLLTEVAISAIRKQMHQRYRASRIAAVGGRRE